MITSVARPAGLCNFSIILPLRTDAGYGEREAGRRSKNFFIERFIRIPMAPIDKRYLVRQRKINETEKDVPVYAKAMRSKTGEFEGVSFIRNIEKASVMTIAEAQQVVEWAATKKDSAKLYVTTIICEGQ